MSRGSVPAGTVPQQTAALPKSRGAGSPPTNAGLVIGDDGAARCSWCAQDPIYQTYHDEEWGRPQHDDVRLFEKICLEGFQAGLSWLTILKKREAFRRAFAGFDFEKVARFNERKVSRLVEDAAIVRHRGKIESTINNAHRALELADEFGSLDAFFWRFLPAKRERPRRMTSVALARMTETDTSRAMAKELRQRGFTYVGPTTCYAFMQSMGLVNDHLEGCWCRSKLA